MDSLIERIKEHEGFRGEPYLDHLDNPTIGYGTLLPLSEVEAELLLRFRLDLMRKELERTRPIIDELDNVRRDVIYEMAYQMGVPSVNKFRNMWRAIEEKDYDTASEEMLDSRWARQTPSRALKLASIMKIAR